MSFNFSNSKNYWKSTFDVLVEPKSVYFKEESDPSNGLWYFVYEIKITNRRKEDIQLLRRKWIIEDDKGFQEEVKGEGVVGQQPVIPPDHQFRYVSACPLWAPPGAMYGHFEVKLNSSESQWVEIPRFELNRASHLKVVK